MASQISSIIKLLPTSSFHSTFINEVVPELLGGSDIYIFSLDLSAAFGDLRHQELFSSLEKTKIDTQILGTLKDYYDKGKARL